MDEAIAKTEAVIAKLKQVRAGLIHDLLTRGLDENGQLRDPSHTRNNSKTHRWDEFRKSGKLLPSVSLELRIDHISRLVHLVRASSKSIGYPRVCQLLLSAHLERVSSFLQRSFTYQKRLQAYWPPILWCLVILCSHV